MTAKATSIVVVNYNGAAFLPRLLSALHRQTTQDFELIFVDNGSCDESLPLVENECLAKGIALTTIANAENLGFAAACQQGCERASGAWIATLNNDTEPDPSWLAELLACTENRPDVGMIASKMLFFHDAGQINSAGIAMDGVGIAWDWRGGEADTAGEAGPDEVFGACAGAALYRRTMLEDIGGFDGDFFAYLEDVDLACRARLAGWRCLFQPRARVTHIHSGTLGNNSSLKSYLLGRNKITVIAKNFPASWLWRYLWLIVAYDLLAVAYGGLSTGQWALLRGRLAGLRALPTSLAKRRRIQRQWHDDENWRRLLQPIQPPWRVARRYLHLKR